MPHAEETATPGHALWAGTRALRTGLSADLGDADVGTYLRALTNTGSSMGKMREQILADTNGRQNLTGAQLGRLIEAEAWRNGPMPTPRKTARDKAATAEREAKAAGHTSPGRRAWTESERICSNVTKIAGATALNDLRPFIETGASAQEVAAWLTRKTAGSLEVTPAQGDAVIRAAAWLNATGSKTKTTRTTATNAQPKAASATTNQPVPPRRPQGTQSTRGTPPKSPTTPRTNRAVTPARRTAPGTGQAPTRPKRKRSKPLGQTRADAENILRRPLPVWLQEQLADNKTWPQVQRVYELATKGEAPLRLDQLKDLAQLAKPIRPPNPSETGKTGERYAGVSGPKRNTQANGFWAGIKTQTFVREVSGGMPTLGKRR